MKLITVEYITGDKPTVTVRSDRRPNRVYESVGDESCARLVKATVSMRLHWRPLGIHWLLLQE